MRCFSKKYQAGFSFLELLISLGIISVLGFTALQHEIENTEMEVAEYFGMDVALYSQAVASYIADEGTGMPSGTFTGFDWLKGSSCGGSAPKDYLPCTWNPRLPFNIELETEVVYGTGVIGDPCSEPVGHVCAETRLTVPATNGQERLDLAAEMLHATQGSSNSVRSTQQSFVLNDVGQVQVTVRGEQSPPTQFLRRDGVNVMQATLNMGDKNLYNVRDVTAEGELEMGRFVDRDDPAFIMDPHQLSVLQDIDARGDLEAPGGGDLSGNSVFNAGANIESVPTFDGEAFFYDLAEFIGGETAFNANVESSGGDAAEFNEANSQDLADFHAELEIVGTGVVGGACNATIENIRFNGAGEMLECVGGLWQYAGIETKKGTITYYSLASTNSYGEFFWAGDGIDIPGRHHICSAQSIEGTTRALGGGAVIEATSGPDSLGRSSFQYLAAAGVEDAESIPLRLQSGERTVICLALGPEPVQPTVSTQTNTAPTGSVSCTDGYVSEPFLSSLYVSDPDTPLLYTWSTSGRCSIVRANSTGDFSAEAWIQRSSSSGTCTVRVQVTDYYNATRTITSSCQVRPRPCPTVQGVCSCSVGQCVSGSRYLIPDPPPPPGYDSRPPPDGQGPWDPDDTWYCDGSCNGGSDYCTEGSSCRGTESGSCSSTINRCYGGNATNYSASRTLDQTTHRWTCRGINGGSNDSCEVIHDHTRPCDPATDRVHGACGTNFGDCTAGNYEPASNQSWICRGICGGTDDECDAPNTNREDGACGTVLNDCPTGTLQTVNSSEWNCLGINGGTDATGCTVPLNGACGNALGACAQGTSSGNTNPWTCQGTNGGSNATCEIAECGTAENTCDRGTYTNITGTHRWRCLGNVAGQSYDDVTCEVGLCGPAQGVCDQGTSSGNTNPWDCAGSVTTSFADDDLGCVVGACGSADDPANGCLQGDWEHVDDTPTAVLWRCLGNYHDATVTTDDADCTLGLPMCKDVLGQCDVGIESGNTNPWTCSGAGATKTCEIGECLFTPGHDVGLCAIGESSDDTGNTNPWVCAGSVGGSSADDATCEQAVCGLADNATEGCIVGTHQHVAGPTWNCNGAGHGTDNDRTCMAPPASECGLSLGDCVQGLSTDPSGSSHTWTCQGQHPDPNVTTDDVDCTFPVCEDQQGVCEFGTPSSNVNPWNCTGIGHGLDTYVKPCSIGVCDYAGPGLCSAGTPDSGGFTWVCEGGDRMSTADDTDCVKAQCKDPGADNDLDACDPGEREDVGGPTWNCLGNAQDPPPPAPPVTVDDATGCRPTVVPGRCGYDFAGDCEEGRKSGQGNEWKCLGPDDADPGDDDDCAIGQCPTTSGTVDECVVGTFENISGDPDNAWRCRGSHPDGYFTDDDARCKPVIDGVCGFATDTCFSGTSSGLPGAQWECLGSNGGVDDICPGPEADRCGETENTCLVGGTSYASPATVHSTHAGCSVQTALSIIDTADDPDKLKWDCQYAYSGSCPNGNTVSGSSSLNCEIPNSDCESCVIPLTTLFGGQSGTSISVDYPVNMGGCTQATVDFLGGSPDYTQFIARATQCGTPPQCPIDRPGTFPDCINSNPVDGACGTADNAVQGCTDGTTYQDEPGPSWTCLGEDGGADTSCGNILGAVCGDAEYTCDAGTAYNPQAGPPPTWICDLDDPYGGVPGVPCTALVGP